MNTTELHQRWWYRLVQVVFTIVLLVATGFVFLLIEGERPHKIFDSENSYIACTNGKQYGLEENGVILTSTVPPYFQDEQFKSWCGYDKTTDPIGIREYYKVIAAERIESSWADFGKLALINLSIVAVVFALIRGTFLYIVVGRFN